MLYTFNKLISTGYIGNDLSIINENYNELDLWTTNISISSEKFYEPLKNFYLFYDDFWKDSINYSYSINAISRLTSFQTNVLENSAKWIQPLVFYYPAITKYEDSNLTNLQDNALEWMTQTYPVVNNDVTNFVENTIAYLYCILYEEDEKINTNNKIIESTNCSTNDTSTSVSCWVQWNSDIACYDNKNACNGTNKTKAAYPLNPNCHKNFTVNCLYENYKKNITRYGIANINSYFLDRYERENILCMILTVKNCNWTKIKVL
jgi:hypothetical protein